MLNKILNHLIEKKSPYIIIALMLFMLGVLAYSAAPVTQNNTADKISSEQTAQVSYTPLAPLPGQDAVGTANVVGYLKNLLNLGIGLAIVLAVLMIVIGGIRYMASDAFTDKKEATTQMTMAVFGLIIALGGYLLLKIINPDLVVFKFSPATRNIVSEPNSTPTEQIVRQIDAALAEGKETRLKIQNDLGGMQDAGPLTPLPSGGFEYDFRAANSDIRKKGLNAAAQKCRDLGSGFEGKESFGRYTCQKK